MFDKENLKKFIEEHKDAIDNGKWDYILDEAEELDHKSRYLLYNLLEKLGVDIYEEIVKNGHGMFPISCMRNNDLIKTLVLPDSTVRIATSAFENCPNLKTVYINDGCSIISVNAFMADKSLTSLRLPRSLDFIDRYAFALCKSLTTIEYDGSKEDWENIDIRIGNDILSLDKIKFLR